MKRKNDLIFILGSLLVVTIAWVIFTINHNATTSTISESLANDVVAITPRFNTNVITKLKQRELVDPSYSFAASAQTVTETNQATQTATLTVTPTPTISGATISNTETPTPTTIVPTSTISITP